jgi:hypothetical protein
MSQLPSFEASSSIVPSWLIDTRRSCSPMASPMMRSPAKHAVKSYQAFSGGSIDRRISRPGNEIEERQKADRMAGPDVELERGDA